jgi:predicted transcriptional regulator
MFCKDAKSSPMSRNEEDSEISKVLFELSSTRRANILFEIQKENLKMQQIAKSLDTTVTETFRHLQRLTDAKLVEKKVDGTYAITSLGNLATGFLSGFNFILKNADYFLEHDVSCIPYEFVNRLGELSNAEFCKEAMSGFNRVRKMVFNAEKYLWTMAEQVDSSHIKPTQEKVSKGLDFKFIMQQDLAKTFANAKDVAVLTGSRYLQRIPVTLVITENEASVTFRTHSGAMDYMGLHGSDEKFRKWTQDLFMYYWERASRWYPNIEIK